MAEKHDTPAAAQSEEDKDDVEGHRFAPDDDRFEKDAESSDDEEDEVEAHKF